MQTGLYHISVHALENQHVEQGTKINIMKMNIDATMTQLDPHY